MVPRGIWSSRVAIALLALVLLAGLTLPTSAASLTALRFGSGASVLAQTTPSVVRTCKQLTSLAPAPVNFYFVVSPPGRTVWLPWRTDRTFDCAPAVEVPGNQTVSVFEQVPAGYTVLGPNPQTVFVPAGEFVEVRFTNQPNITPTLTARVCVAHQTGDNTNPVNYIEVLRDAVDAHLRHGDSVVGPAPCPSAGNVITPIPQQASHR